MKNKMIAFGCIALIYPFFHFFFWFVNSITPKQQDMGELLGVVDMSWQQNLVSWLLGTFFNVPFTTILLVIAFGLFYGAKKI